MKNDRPRKMVEPRLSTPIGSTQGTGMTPLPDDLLAAQCVRMALMYAVGAGLWTMGLVMGSLVLPDANQFGPYAAQIKTVGIATCLLMLGYTRFSPCGHPRKINVGLTFLVVNAFLIALLNSWTEQPLTFRPLSWIAIVIVVYAMIAPSTPRKMFVASMIAATMDPLGVWLAHRRGLPVPRECVDRDWSQPHRRNPQLVDVFKLVYDDPKRYWDAYEMCEKLIDVDESFQLWRFRHLKTVERIIGYKTGTGGSSGVAFLKRALEHTFFPELIDVRTLIGAK